MWSIKQYLLVINDTRNKVTNLLLSFYYKGLY